MTDLNMPANTIKVPTDIGTILANLVSQHISGAMKQYAEARLNGQDIPPELAKAAYLEASKLIEAARATNQIDVSLGGSKSISVSILEDLLGDINRYAKFAASRQGIKKLASKFEKLIK
jgi:hypothetical protein